MRGAQLPDVLGIPLALGRDTMTPIRPRRKKSLSSIRLSSRNICRIQVHSATRSAWTARTTLQESRFSSPSSEWPEQQFPQHSRETVAGRLCSVHANDRKQADGICCACAWRSQHLASGCAAVLRELDPNLPLERPTTQRAQFEESIRLAPGGESIAVLWLLRAACGGLYGPCRIASAAYSEIAAYALRIASDSLLCVKT